MNRKATIIAAAVLSLAGLSTVTGCSTLSYTGTAVVKEHRESGKNCFAKLETSNQEIVEFNMGLRHNCEALTDGSTVTMENGLHKKG